MYYTGYIPRDTQNIPAVGGDVDTYLHMFWNCPRVARFWGEVVELTNIRLQLTLLTTPELLLGIHNDNQRPRRTKFINLILVLLC